MTTSVKPDGVASSGSRNSQELSSQTENNDDNDCKSFEVCYRTYWSIIIHYHYVVFSLYKIVKQAYQASYMQSERRNQQLAYRNYWKTIYNPSPVYVKNGEMVTELSRTSPVAVFFLGFVPPVTGAFAAILTALIFHNEQINNYDWQCGRARLPSLSRIINLPLERLFWQFLMLVQTPARFIELFTGFCRYGRLVDVNYQHKRFYEFARYVYFYFGIAELFSMIGLSLLGERENIQVHVILFYIFGFCGVSFFIANLICHRHSLYFLHPYGRLSYYLKLTFCIIYLLSIPILLTSFLLYWKICVTDAYDVFAICEYIEVLLNIAYHGCAFYDIRYKVIFTVRHVEDARQFLGNYRKEIM